MHKERKEEERERKTDQEQRKKKQKRWRKGVRSKSLSVFTHLGMGSDALWRHWAVVADASGNQTSTPTPAGGSFSSDAVARVGG